jgi:hypothetical protein
MLEIRHLEVQFDVTGDDKQVFAELFTRHVGEWSSQRDEDRRRDLLGAAQRTLDDTPEVPPW